MNKLIQKKIRIVIDLQGFQRDSNRVRGIGRYSIQLVKSLINNYPENIYILLSNSSLYNFKKDFDQELNDLRLKDKLSSEKRSLPGKLIIIVKENFLFSQ